MAKISTPAQPTQTSKPKLKIHFEVYLVFFIALVALALITSLIAPLIKRQANTNSVGSANQTIEQLAAHSFGDLSTSVSSSISRTNAQAGEVATLPTVATDKMIAKPAELIAPDGISGYTYSYAGTLPAIPATSEVVKRLTSSTGFDAASIAGDFGFGLINLSSFQKLGIQQISFSQSTSDGYVISIDGLNGTVSLYQSTMALSKDTAIRCLGTTCETNQALPPVTVPADSTLTSLTNLFLQNHGISRSSYGSPEVIKNTNEIQPALEGVSSYVSDYSNIVYPLLINGKNVYSASGDLMGMQATVNIRTMQVTAVYNILLQKFQTSQYGNETNIESLKKIITQGGVYDMIAQTEGTPTDVQLDAPVSAYVQLARYADSAYDELYVPALVFKVSEGQTKAPTWKQRVVVPLVKELLQTNVSSGSSGSGSTSSGSAQTTDVAPLTTPVSN